MNRTVMQQNADIHSYFKESIDGVETIKAANASDRIKKQAREKFERFLNSFVKNAFFALTQETLANCIEMLGTVWILWCGFSYVSQGILSLGTVITFYALLVYFATPMKNLIELQPKLQDEHMFV